MSKQAETLVWKRALLKFSPLGYRLFRNQRYKGQIVVNGKVTDARCDAGLVDGSGDLIGYRIIIITAEMIGRKIAQFVSFEAKTESGTVRPEQKTFMECINRDGGEARVIRPKDVE